MVANVFGNINSNLLIVCLMGSLVGIVSSAVSAFWTKELISSVVTAWSRVSVGKVVGATISFEGAGKGNFFGD